MVRGMGRLGAALAAGAAVIWGLAGSHEIRPAMAQDAVARGQYIVSIIGCTDCHTDGALLGQPDMEHYLGGSNTGFGTPQGVFYGPNLTSDPTGLGDWTDEEIVTAIREGVRPDGRMLHPVMPYHNFANLTDADAYAMVAYLRTLPPVARVVPGPFGPTEVPTAPYLAPVFPQQ